MVFQYYSIFQMVLSQSPYLIHQTKALFFRNRDIPNFYNKTEIDAIDDELPSLILNTYTKTEANNLLTNINLTGSENIDINNNQVSLTYPLQVNNEACLNPRVNGYFEIYAAPNRISLLQHIPDGSQPIAMFNSLEKCRIFRRS